jgi:hypothetical protein
MNVRVDVDITPEELRRLMGLPDVQGFQQELLDKIRAQMEQGAEGYDPQALMRPFLTNAFASMDAFQKLFAGMAAAGAGRREGEEGPK